MIAVMGWLTGSPNDSCCKGRHATAGEALVYLYAGASTASLTFILQGVQKRPNPARLCQHGTTPFVVFPPSTHRAKSAQLQDRLLESCRACSLLDVGASDVVGGFCRFRVVGVGGMYVLTLPRACK